MNKIRGKVKHLLDVPKFSNDDLIADNTLSSDDSVELFLKGRTKWNEWVVANPEYNISFSGVDFSILRDKDVPRLLFDKFKFPKGFVSFQDANFGEGDVYFRNASFGDGDLSFARAEFGEGHISFVGAIFGIGNVDFLATNFGDGDVFLKRATFGKGWIVFDGANIGEGRLTFDGTIFNSSALSFTGFRSKNSLSFSDAKFESSYVDLDYAEIGGGMSLKNAKFDGCHVSISNTSIGQSSSFSKAIFSSSLVSFDRAYFADGDVNFEKVQFDYGVSFRKVSFGSGKIVFDETIFGKGDVSFEEASFGDGNISYDSASFGDGDVSFKGASIGHGTVSFSKASFGVGDILFDEVAFGDGNVSFFEVIFGDGHLSFFNAAFGAGKVVFERVSLKHGSVSFDNVSCASQFLFSSDDVRHMSFRAGSFNNSVALTNITLDSVIDLVNTKFSHQLSLYGLTCKLRTRTLFGFNLAKDSGDIERLNRAKELAEVNKHHALALKFHSDEMRAKRWQKDTSVLSSILDFTFDKLCNYGQSVWRPFYILLISIILFTFPYIFLSNSYKLAFSFNSEILMFSLANSLPFLITTRDARINGMEQFFAEHDMLASVYAIMTLQGLISVILLFLIGLGLRNRFRI